jgi:hypothetical protein
MNIQTLIALSVVPVGLTGCAESGGGCDDSESKKFSYEDDEILAHYVLNTGDYQAGHSVEDIACEQVCYNVAQYLGWAGQSVSTSSCEMTLDATYFSDLSSDTADTGLDATVVGSITCAGTVTNKVCLGRRPLGHIEARLEGGGLGRYLACAAHLEAASVHAFAELSEQLERWGAPAALIARCRRAMGDEIRHARDVGKLAMALGYTPAAALREATEGDLLSVAIHNATEGCVSETWAALEAHMIAGKTPYPAFREVFAQIAQDETRHAQLSWDLHAWLCAQLGPAERAQVLDAQRQAIAALASTGVEHLNSLPAEFGLDGLTGASELVERFTQGLAA